MENVKSDFRRKLDTQLDELEELLVQLKAKAHSASDESKAKYKETIDELEPKIANLKLRLKNISESSDLVWDDLKEGGVAIWEQIKSTFVKVKSHFDDEDKTESPKSSESSTDEYGTPV